MKPRAYIETTVPSYLTAWPSSNLIRAAEQRQTALWWAKKDEYDLLGSQLLVRECSKGDPSAAADRMKAIAGLTLLDETAEVAALADALVKLVPLPQKALSDAAHIAFATVYGADLLVSWNCRHVVNPTLRPRVEAVCRAMGYDPPIICTPADLLAEKRDG